ncbi:zeta toxin family protein [Legionella massiliensis]|nr:zeta toxin family protein [Legionella massiliensis]
MKNRQPRVFAVAGAPAAGKTTFVQQQIQTGVFPSAAFIHDCDLTMQNLKGYQEDLQRHGSAFAFSKWEMPARYLAEEELAEALRRKQDIIYDRSCALNSSLSFLEHLVTEKNYQLYFYYLEVDVETAERRALAREKATGRHVPVSLIKERISSLQKLLPAYQRLAHYFSSSPANIYD